MKFKMFLLVVAICALGCNKKSNVKEVVISNKDTLNQEVFHEEYENEPEEVALEELKFPITGKNAEAFVLEPCEIKMRAEGFLNEDNLKDIVIVLQNKSNRADSRATLVLLQQETGIYKLQELSWEAVGQEYLESGSPFYDVGEISIDKDKTLHILLEGMAPVGSRETVYKYVNNKLVLIKIRTFHSGAGSYVSSKYDLVSGEVDHEVVNTLYDSLPSEHQIEKFKLKRQILFTNDNPDTILENLPQANW
ncbi:hypothetical protein [Flavobacterium reichenbachii]|uniref:Uncharacterized protein n=1 Tax=Flavobacterium reichenbachii TaxID=362418 RepID=A0A085ZS32_9FLAO|nr:hypothetical protein [Flavobacterium reichenbachii]KFF07246.1 hypothetical protein IW19_17800 [Flavobacterium reichenbachii]OXB13264.1 hypothetical protein B0A68_16010 [Flavobacterium reichenbachii]